MNLLWLLLIPFADRFVGMGIVSRFISLPLASTIIGTSLMLAMQLHWEWILIFGGLFALGRGPNVANGLNLVNKLPVNPQRDGWDTKWITLISGDSIYLWVYYRIYIYYFLFFTFIEVKAHCFGFAGAIASSTYAICWVTSYALVKPIRLKLGCAEYPNCYTQWAESIQCVLFAVIIWMMLK